MAEHICCDKAAHVVKARGAHASQIHILRKSLRWWGNFWRKSPSDAYGFGAWHSRDVGVLWTDIVGCRVASIMAGQPVIPLSTFANVADCRATVAGLSRQRAQVCCPRL